MVTNGIPTSKTTTGRSLSRGLGKEGKGSHLRHKKTHEANTNELIENTTGTGESGFGKPRIGNNVFSSSPTSIRKRILTPTERTIRLLKRRLSNLAILRIKNPGINVMKRKPSNCLAKKMLKMIDARVAD
jgi:hypothetical protein